MTKHQDKKQSKTQDLPDSGTKGGKDGGGNYKNDTERMTSSSRNKNSEQTHGVRKN